MVYEENKWQTNIMLAVVLSLVVAQVAGWWCNGHMTVANIAKLDLQQSAPEVLDAAEAIVKLIPPELAHGTSNNFVEAACWADDLKANSLVAMAGWHFIDRPYNVNGLLVLQRSATSEDVVWAINQSVFTLS